MSDLLTGAADLTAGIVSGNPASIATGAADVLTGLITDLSGGSATTQVQHAQAESDISTYEQYLKDFPQYQATAEAQYTANEGQVLGGQLAAMGVRGGSETTAEGVTSAGAAYGGEKSLYDQGYTELSNQLQLEQTKAQGQLAVAQSTAENTQTGGLFGHGGFLGTGIG